MIEYYGESSGCLSSFVLPRRRTIQFISIFLSKQGAIYAHYSMPPTQSVSLGCYELTRIKPPQIILVMMTMVHRSSLFIRPPRPTSAYSTTTSGQPHQPHCRQSFFSHLLEYITRRDRVSIGPHAFCNSLTSCSCPTPAGWCCLTSVNFTSWMYLECAQCTCIALFPVPAAKTSPFYSCCLL